MMYTSLRNAKRSARSGFSLTEVLVAAFIGLIGLLSLAALIPLGLVQIAQTVRADTAGFAARAAWRDIRVHDLLSYTRGTRKSFLAGGAVDTRAAYFRADGTAYQTSATFEFPNDEPEFSTSAGGTNVAVAAAPQGAYVIDPFGLAFTNSPDLMGVFPCLQSAETPPMGLERITIGIPDPNNLVDNTLPPSEDNFRIVPLRGTRAIQRFTPLVDAAFTEPDPGTGRPQRVFASDGRAGIDGNYSWMVTVNPSFDPVRANDVYYGTQNPLCTVSVVVFHRRTPTATNYPTEEEARVYVAFPPGGGISGGDVRIAWNGDSDSIPKIRPGDWIMLYQFASWDTNPRWIAKWYEVLSTDREPKSFTTNYNSGDDPLADFLLSNYQGARPPSASVNLPAPNWFRSLTLRGADWDTAPTASYDGSGNLVPVDYLNEKRLAFGAVCSRVIGVYEKTMFLSQQ